ncbi:MAG: hypothetical protein JXA11_09820 [Phycisphaerae bacterium]|nr:hypothetical protein [Phycisphaerae bacterium]
MDTNTVIGVFLILAALGLLVGLILFSRRRIHRIDRLGPQSARMLLCKLSRIRRSR